MKLVEHSIDQNKIFWKI